ncbi:MAG: thiol-disulfide oxidoreductase DCC family protein [Planctomycetota bacterium JB042]
MSGDAVNGWTGGQISLVRVLVALVAMTHAPPCEDLLRCLAVAALSIAFLLGWHWRLAGFAILSVILATRDGGTVGVHGPILLLVFTPGVPYGAWPARGRPDPDGGFRLGRVFLLVARGLVLLSAFSLWRGHMDPDLGLVLLLLLACDPAWIPGTRADGEERLFYDGDCGLCHRFVRFLLAEDRHATLRLAPLQGETFAATIPDEERAALPDSLVLRTADGRTLTRTAAVVHALSRLGGLWRLAAALLRVVPRPLRDLGYDLVAKVRKRVFPAPEGVCPIVPPDLAARFDP